MSEEPVTRKLAAILFADVAGYSRMTGEDEEGTYRRVRAYLDAITTSIKQHNGTVLNFAGDAVLADFTTATDALICAVDIQRDLETRNTDLPDDRKVRFRIGVNLGEVIVDRGEIFGNGVNIAARLESLAEPGGICISSSVYDAIGTKLPFEYELMGEQSVKNIAEPVRVYAVRLRPGAVLPAPSRARTGALPRRLAAVAVLIVLLIGAGWIGWLMPWSRTGEPPRQDGAELPLPDKPSIAVLPFANLSGDPAQEYFSDGMTEDLITDLSKVSGLFVIARNSSFAYKGRQVDLREVGEALGVRYVLEGSVRKSGDRVRINAQLIDAGSGGHVWAERFDRDMEDIFDLQDEVTQKIVSALAVTLKPAEAERRSHKTKIDPDAYDTFLRGLERLRRFTPETNAEARDFFRQALEIDPRYGRAYSALGFAFAMDVFLGAAVDREDALHKAERYATVALRLDEEVPQVQFAVSFIHQRLKRFDLAVQAAERAIELDTNYADGYAQLASALVHAGRAEDALTAIGKSIRLNPQQPFFYLEVMARAFFMLGRYDEAARVYAQIVESNPGFVIAHRGLAASYAHLGIMEDAAWEAAEVLALQPDFSLKAHRETSPFKRKEDMDRYIDGLRKAGLPE